MDYTIVKTIEHNKKKVISIIEIDNNKYLLKKSISNDLTTINMLKNEVVSLDKLSNSKYVPKLINFYFVEENYLYEELIEGTSIKNHFFSSTKEIFDIFLSIIEAIKDIHSYSVIHCDLKPDNILITKNNEIRVIDFGISKNDENDFFNNYGSYKYCSIYQLNHEKLDFKTDIYSLSIILYELLVKKNPFGNNKNELIKNKKMNNYIITQSKKFNDILSKSFEGKYNDLEEYQEDILNLAKVLITN